MTQVSCRDAVGVMRSRVRQVAVMQFDCVDSPLTRSLEPPPNLPTILSCSTEIPLKGSSGVQEGAGWRQG